MIERKRLPTQLFTGSRPEREKFIDPENYGSSRPSGYMKPYGGLWTSTWESAFDVGWPGWMLQEEWRLETLREAWLLEPVECRVIELAGFDMVHDFMLEYGTELYPRMSSMPPVLYTLRDGRQVDGSANLCPVWERVKQDADAVRLLTPYDFDVRLGPYLAFYGWDCESTLWLRWCFEDETVQVDLSDRIESSEEGGIFTR